MPMPTRMLLVLTVFTALVSGLYFNTVYSPFVFDDVPFVQQNPDLAMDTLSLENLKKAALASTRPVTNLSFAFNYYYGQHRVAGYHFINMVLHIMTGMGVYFLARILFSMPWFSSRYGLPGWMPFLAALIWLVHPVQTGSVTYIVQRANIMASIFYVWAFVLYAAARLSSGQRKNVLWGLCAICGLFGLGAKETVLTLPFFILLFEWFFFQDMNMARIGRLLFILAVFFMLVIIGAFVFLGTHPLQSMLYDYKNFDFTMGQRVLTEFRVIAHYIFLLVFPHPGRLILDHDPGISTGLFSPPATFFCIIMVAVLVALAVILAKKQRIISFAIFWFLGNLFLESSFIPLDLVFDHRLYLPFMFPVIAFGVLVLHSSKTRMPATIALICAALVFMTWTWQRNQVWLDSVSLWQDTVNKVPNNARAHNNLGLALAEDGRPKDATRHFVRAIKIKPGFALARYNLGICLANQEKHGEAVIHFKAAKNADPKNVLYRNDLALSLMAIKDVGQATIHLYAALREEPEYAPTHNNLGIALMEQKMIAEASSHFVRAVELEPKYADAHRNLGMVLAGQEKHKQAAEHFSATLKLIPNDAQAHFYLGRSLAAMDKLKDAARHFSKAAELAPGYAPAHYNAGVTLMGLLKYKEAADYFRHVLRIEPKNAKAKKLFKKCMEKSETPQFRFGTGGLMP